MRFVQYVPRPSGDQLNTFDFNGLNQMRRGVQGGSQHEIREAAHQFEALFIQQMLKQSRQVAPESSLFNSDQTRLVQSLQDEQVAAQLADPGMGLAKAILDQIRRVQGIAADGQVPTFEGKERPPEMASSRLPHLQSVVGDATRPEHASSIGALIELISQGAAAVGERIQSAIRGAPQHIQQFVSRMRDAARIASAESGVPEKLILSQAALESGWGRREIRGEDGSTSYNLFGIKATGGWSGKVVHITTTEYIDGEPRKLTQPFRAYNSYAESFADYARLISKNSRYAEVLTAPSAEEAARRIQAAGYATDPAYADKLISIMQYFETTGMTRG